jgi:hypothetical protein
MKKNNNFLANEYFKMVAMLPLRIVEYEYLLPTTVTFSAMVEADRC